MHLILLFSVLLGAGSVSAEPYHLIPGAVPLNAGPTATQSSSMRPGG